MPSSPALSENIRPRSVGFVDSPPSPLPSPKLHRENRRALHLLADESEDGYSSHPSIYSASPVGSADSVHNCSDSSANSPGSTKLPAGIFEQDVEDVLDGTGGLAGRRNFSSFSGLSMLDTISEQKSGSTRSGLGEEDASFTLDSSDDEYEYGRSYYYEYASPTQPLHPARSQSAPLREINPLLNPQGYQSTSVPIVHTFFSRSPTRDTESTRPLPQRPTFRPPTSMNHSYGTLMAHPFHRAPMANRRIDGDIPTPDELGSPENRSRVSLAGGGESGWSKLFRGCCLICCCMSVGDNEYNYH